MMADGSVTIGHFDVIPGIPISRKQLSFTLEAPIEVLLKQIQKIVNPLQDQHRGSRNTQNKQQNNKQKKEKKINRQHIRHAEGFGEGWW